jgi:N-methylhydantoinase A
MGLSVEQAAEGILRVVNATMIRGIRLVTVEKGLDPRDFALVCFGGAGPLHAVKLAQELGIRTILVPGGPGVTCALGLLMADFRHDYSRTFVGRLATLDPGRLQAAFAALEARAWAQMTVDGFTEDSVVLTRAADLRHAGQGYELEVPVPTGDCDRAMLDALAGEFGQRHCAKYGYAMAPETVEIITLRLVAIGVRAKPVFAEQPEGPPDPAPALKSRRRAFMDGAWHDVPVYDRALLACGMRVAAPAIVEQEDSTTALFEGYGLEVDRFGNLVIRERANA